MDGIVCGGGVFEYEIKREDLRELAGLYTFVVVVREVVVIANVDHVYGEIDLADREQCLQCCCILDSPH